MYIYTMSKCFSFLTVMKNFSNSPFDSLQGAINHFIVSVSMTMKQRQNHDGIPSAPG